MGNKWVLDIEIYVDIKWKVIHSPNSNETKYNASYTILGHSRNIQRIDNCASNT